MVRNKITLNKINIFDLKRHIVLFLLLIFIFSAAGPATYSYAADKVTIVEGLIENVADDFIKIKGKEYNISNVPVKDFGGREASKKQIKRGVFARIVFEGSRITTLMIDIGE